MNLVKQRVPEDVQVTRCKVYDDVTMSLMASQITSLTVVYSTVYSDADQRKHKSSASLAFVWGIHRDRWIPRTKGQLRGICFYLMTSPWVSLQFTLSMMVRLISKPHSTWCVQKYNLILSNHHSDVIMSAINGVSIVCSTICLGVDLRKCQSSASLPFVSRIHQWPVDSPHKWPVTRKLFPFDDAIMSYWFTRLSIKFHKINIRKNKHTNMFFHAYTLHPVSILRLLYQIKCILWYHAHITLYSNVVIWFTVCRKRWVLSMGSTYVYYNHVMSTMKTNQPLYSTMVEAFILDLYVSNTSHSVYKN